MAVLAAVAAACFACAAAWAIRRDARRLRKSERWQRHLRGELMSTTAFLDGLVASLRAISGSLDADTVREHAAEQAQALLGADASLLLVPDADGRHLRPTQAAGLALGPIAGQSVALDAPASLIAEAVRSRTAAAGAAAPDADGLVRHLRPTAVLAAPLVVMGEVHAVLVLVRLEPGTSFGPDDVTRTAVFADDIRFASG